MQNFELKGHFTFYYKSTVEKRTRRREKTFTNVYKVFRKHTYTRAQWRIAGYKVKNVGMLLLCVLCRAMQQNIDKLLLLWLQNHVQVECTYVIYALHIYLPDAFPYDDFQLLPD